MTATILLVEDNEDNRVIYRTILEHAGYLVVEAVDGAEAIRSVRELRPDLVLMDISIPQVDGYEAARILKADPETSLIPILALTAHALEADRERAAEVGIAVYLTKPIEPRVVLEEVRRFLAGGVAPVDGPPLPDPV